MASPEKEFELSKNESKILSSLVKFGGQSKKELNYNTELQIDKIESSLSELQSKGLVIFEEETGAYATVLPIERLINMLDNFSSSLDTGKKNQTEKLQQYKKDIDEELNKFRAALENQILEFKSSSNSLQDSLKEILEAKDNERIKKADETIDEILSSFSSSMSQTNAATQSVISTETGKFEKKWSEALDSLQKIPETGERNLRKSISGYEEELSKTTVVVSDKITSLHSQLSDIVTAIQSETTAQIQEFFSNTGAAAAQFKSNFNTGLNESRKKEKELVDELRQQVKVKFVDNITNVLGNIVKELSTEMDKRIEEALDKVKQQTEITIKETSNQIKSTFTEFAETAKELIKEQQSPLGVLSTELTEISTEQKLDRVLNTFIQQFQAHLATDLNTLETNYLRVQKSIMEIMEEIRRTSKNKLTQQNKEFEKLIVSFTTGLEKNLARKDMDIVHLQQLSNSIEQLLHNLLISIPMRSNHIKTTVTDAIENSANELQKISKTASQDAITDINKTLENSQTKIETAFRDTLEECQNETDKVVTASDQLNNIVSNLQDNYLETIQSRFEQRAKVMNTELEAVARNFQQILNSIESGVADINERITSDTGLIDIDTTIQNSVTQLKNEINTIFNQTQTYSRDFVTQLDSNLQKHLDRTLETIKEGFNQLKTEFNSELEKQLIQINDKNSQQQQNLVTAIDEFYDQSTEKFVNFRTSLIKSVEENQKNISEFIVESRNGTEEVINSHKSNIAKYLEKGPTDILSFIKQVETEVSTQNKNLKDTLEELVSYYKGFSDSTLVEITGILREIHDSGDKLSNTFNDSLQSTSSALTKANENIDMYFSDSMTELENQIGVTTGFITSEVASSVNLVQEERQSLGNEMKEIVNAINAEMKALIEKQDQDFQDEIPEINQEFTNMFNDLVQVRSNVNSELEEKTEKILANLITSWNKQMESARTSLKDVTKAINDAIESNIKNFEVIVETNVEQAINRINTIYSIDSSIGDTIGVKEISETIKKANKRLKSSISDGLKSHIDNFDQQLPELLTSYDAIHTQIEEDLAGYLEDLSDLISSSQSALTQQIHNYLKEERDIMDFSETKDELSNIIRNFSQATTQSVEDLSNGLLETIQRSIKEVDRTKDEIQGLFTGLSESLGNQNTELTKNLEQLKDRLLKNAQDIRENSRKDINTKFESYNNDLEKVRLELTGKSSQLVQSVNEDIESQETILLEQLNAVFNEFISTNEQYRKLLKDMGALITQTKPLETLKLINLPNDENKNSFIIDMINKAAKQVTIFTSNPTCLSVEDLKAIRSEKRVWIFTNYDFTKKGKKWFSELNEQVNINLRKAKAAKLSGFLVIRDVSQALVLPESLGFTTSDSKFISYLSSLLAVIKGPSFGRNP